MNFKDRLTELCSLDGISGDERSVREYIIAAIDGKCEYRTDNLGNLIVFKRGRERPKNKVMISAHMDEVGLIVTSVKDDGTLTLAAVGGVDTGVVIGRRIRVGKSKIQGVIGAKAVHNLTDDEKDKMPSLSSLYADIGVSSREEAEKLVSAGDCVYFDSELYMMGEDYLCAKAIDDRFGCAVMLSLIETELPYDCTFTFVVQEEVGLRGSRTAAYSVDPDFALVLEATTAADIPLADGEKKCCILGKGAVVSYMDRSTIYDRELFELSKSIAADNSIGWQTKTMVAGGNDSGAIHISRGGVRTLAVSAPCRYLHSPCCVARLCDMEDCRRLAGKLIEKMCTL